MVSLTVLFSFFFAFFHWLFGIRSPAGISFQSLLGKSFRIPEKDTKSIRFLFFIFKDTFRKVYKARIYTAGEENSTSAVYDLHPHYFELRREYIRSFQKDPEIHTGFFKDELLILYYNKRSKITDLTLFFFLYCIFFPFALLSKNKGVIILIPKEVLETIQLVRGIRKRKVSEVYFFCIYEKDANFIGHVLNKSGIRYFKITSEVPIAVWNQKIVADHLCVCFGYQLEEAEYFKKTVFYSKITVWGPERSHQVKAIYENKEAIEKELLDSKDLIGFYSTGGWIRKKLGHLDQGRDIIESEGRVLNVLSNYCRQEKKKLMVFLHPREKSKEYFEECKAYYQTALKNIEFDFANMNESTSALFHKVNLAVAFSSTVVFERIYFGFKTLIMPVGFKDFPIPGTAITSICADSETALAEKIELAMKQSNSEFFKVNQLERYSTYSWK